MTKQQTPFWNIFFALLGVLAIGIVCVFIGFFIFYSWQFKFGTSEKIIDLTKQFEQKFSSVSTDKNAPPTVPKPESFIHTDNPMIGDKDAPITIMFFSDFECPYSQEQQSVIEYLTTTYQPVVRIVFKHMPLESIHAHAQNAAMASMCAHEQEKFWEYTKVLFQNKELNETSLFNIAQQINIDMLKFNNCFTQKTYKKIITQDITDSQILKLRGTPTYIVNGEIIEGSKTKQQWDEIILKHLNTKAN